MGFFMGRREPEYRDKIYRDLSQWNRRTTLHDHKHHGPGHHAHHGTHADTHPAGHGHGRHGTQQSCETPQGYGVRPDRALLERALPARDGSEQAFPSPAGEGCPKRGGTGECPGDCRACSYNRR
jgi:hypothetical protein